MTVVRLALRADVRQRWQALLALAVLLGLVGGVVLTAAAGARRTDTAYPRLLAWSSSSQVEIVPQGTGTNGFYQALAKVPQVEAMSTGSLWQAMLPGAAGRPVQLMSSYDGALGLSVDRARVLAGQPYDPRKPGQAMIDEVMAQTEHLRPGDTVRVLGVPNNPATQTPDLGRATMFSFRVTAIVAFDPPVALAAGGNVAPTVLVSSPFAVAAVAAHVYNFGDEAAVRLRPGAFMSAFLLSANALARQYKGSAVHLGTGGRLDVISPADQIAALERSAHPQAVALAAFAALAGLIALAVLSQLLSRQLALDAAEFPVLHAVGVTRATLVGLSMARLAVITVTGALIAVPIAVAASPLMPIGPARAAEPTPGIEINLAVLGAGAALIALLPLVVLAYPAWRTVSRAAGRAGPAGSGAGSPRRSWRPGPAGWAGSVTGVVGVRMAFEPDNGRVPVRSAVAGSVAAVAAVIAALVFGTSLVALVNTPRAYGQNWDAVADFQFGALTARTVGAVLAGDNTVAGYAGGNYGDVTIRDKAIPAIGLDQPHGGYLTLLAGRAPAVPGEIALGEQTLRSLGLHLGEAVQVKANHEATATPDVTTTMRIVGIVVLPSFSRGSFAPTDLGAGAVVPASVLTEPNSATRCTSAQTCYNFFLLRYRPGTDAAAAHAKLTAILAALHCPVGSCVASSEQRPEEIKNYASIRDTPLLLGVVLAALTVGTFAHVMLTSVRRRRRDLATLKALGLTRPQVLRVIAWQATALAAVAVAVGVPAGIITGRQAWAFFANGAGVAPRPDVPLTLVLLTVPATLLLANVIAAWPGVAAARVRPAAVLRAE